MSMYDIECDCDYPEPNHNDICANCNKPIPEEWFAERMRGDDRGNLNFGDPL